MTPGDDEEEKKKYSGCVFYAVVAPVSILLGPAWQGWVLAKLWLWFVVGTFDVRPLNVPQALGLSILLSSFTTRSAWPKGSKDLWAGGEQMLATAFGVPLITLTMGAIVTKFL